MILNNGHNSDVKSSFCVDLSSRGNRREVDIVEVEVSIVKLKSIVLLKSVKYKSELKSKKLFEVSQVSQCC